jgi:hypothetical protein
MKVRTSLSLACLLVLGASGFSQSVSFERRTYSNLGGVHADLNNDGREDFIHGSPTQGARVFQVVLSTGDGVWGAPQNTPVPDADPNFFAVGDFNGDGKADVIVTNGTNYLYEYFGNGDGTFRVPILYGFPSGQRILQALVGNFNQDSRPDLVFAYSTDPNGSAVDMQVYFGNSDGGFTPGPITTNIPSWGSAFAVADFDGDGKADVYSEYYDGYSGSFAQVLFGDGAGHFPARVQVDQEGQYAEPRDVNGDGKMDLLAIPFYFSTNGSLYYPYVIALYGSSSRTFTRKHINFSQCLQSQVPEVADLNGDSIPDFIFVERSNCDEDFDPATYKFVVATGRSDGTFDPEQTLGTDYVYLQTILRANRDTKADVLVSRTLDSGAQEFDVLLNTATGTFPGCAAPNGFRGINVCSPPTNGVTVASPITFSIGAATQTPGRKIEVWIDGVKRSEQLKQQFSRYAYLDLKGLPLENGNHNITVYAAGFDNLLQKTSFTIFAGNSGGECAVPAGSTTVVICFPQNGSTVSSPVRVAASGGTAVTYLEVWVDGTKRFTSTNDNRVDTFMNFGNGSHQMTVFGRNSSGVVGKATSTFTVSNSTCAQPTSATATVICSPANGASLGSPVTVQARGGSSVNFMEVWVDGTKRFQTSGNSVSTAVALGAGSHKMTVFSRNGTTVLSSAVSTFSTF